jgi:hypothetical protein
MIEAAANSIGRAHSLSRSLTATTSESWHVVVVYLAASTLALRPRSPLSFQRRARAGECGVSDIDCLLDWPA